MPRRLLAAAFLLAMASPVLGTTDDFVRTCVAYADDLASLPAALEADGLKEVDAATGPQFMPLPDTVSRRLWQRPAVDGAKSSLYVSLITVPGEVPFTLCLTVGLPGDNALVSLEKLQALYPPHPGSVTREPHIFYGGRETWTATVDGADYAFTVSWSFGGMPESGPSTQELLIPGASAPSRAQ